MFLRVLGIVTIIAYAGFNLFTAKTYSAREMREEFITGQCTVGVICANVFYAPAWVLKLLRKIVVTTVK